MKKPGLEGAAWPSGREELALRAALLDGDAVLAAWNELAEGLDRQLAIGALADEHPEVLRLLPLVHHNVRRIDPDDARVEALGSTAKRNWYRTRTIIDRAAPALARLSSAGVPTMVLKGTPLALAYYDNPGLRFVSDVDVMVPHAAAARSLDLLASEGWQRASAIPRHRLFRARHSENLHHAEYGNLDLHWRLSMPLVVASNGEASEADFWEAAEPVEVSGVPTQMPCPEDLLLHVCVHGAWTTSGATARWVADAVTIVRRAGDRIDWERLVEQVERRHVGVRMRNDLAYVAREFGAPVPEAALEQLRHLPVSRRERRTYLALTREPPSTALGRRLAVFNGYWLEKTGAIPRWRQVYEFPGHLQDQFGLAHAWEIPIELTARFAREVRQLGRSHRDGRE